MSDKNLSELITDYEDEHSLLTNEGRRGVENLCKLVEALGYDDPQYFGQFAGGSYGTLINFLEDNSGCVEAIKEWIAKQDNEEWKENLESELPEEDEECPYCGGDCANDVENRCIGYIAEDSMGDVEP